VGDFSAREGTVSNYMTHCETTFGDWQDAAIIAAGPFPSAWQIGTGMAELQARSAGSGAAAHGAVPSPQAPALGPCGEGCSLEALKTASIVVEKAILGDRENKPLRAISNRNSNDSRKRATLSESITSKFLIATKTHASEEKAKQNCRL
jgi:hypothetical protein